MPVLFDSLRFALPCLTVVLYGIITAAPLPHPRYPLPPLPYLICYLAHVAFPLPATSRNIPCLLNYNIYYTVTDLCPILC